MNVVSARAAALAILAARRVAPDTPPSTAYSLARFQQEGVARANAIIRQRNGVIIADSVGLGKTYIAAALIEQYLVAGRESVVVIPASLRGPWRRALRPLADMHPAGVRILTHGQLSRQRFPPESAGLVVVDEAHAFRNPHTSRYRALQRLCLSAPVALLTASPVNNSLLDLYFQIRLFAPDNAFRDLGFSSLAALLRSQEIDAGALERLRNAVMVRRTRAELRSRYRQIELPDGQRLEFPQNVQLTNVPYPPLVDTTSLRGLIEQVEFAVYRSQPVGVLVALSLLKRMQSSRDAAVASLKHLTDFHHRFLLALAQGRFLHARSINPHNREQLTFVELLDELPSGLSTTALGQRVRADLSYLEQFREQLRHIPDAKLPRLIDLLDARPPPARTLIFSEFRDTAEHLWRSLQHRFQVALITGSSSYLGASPASRMDVIRRFAPLANHAPEPPASARVDVLIATDVLAEGLNLQDADAVVSYDLPWNPVRLIQRAGRIDRIGSNHDQIHVYNFMPDRELDQFIELVRRLRHKLAGIRAAVGQDAAILETDEAPPAFFQRLIHGDADVIADSAPAITFESDPFMASETVRNGVVASTSCTASRVLLCFRAGTTLRELIIHGDQVMEDKAQCDPILQRALQSSYIADSTSIADAVELAETHLLSSIGPVGLDREAALLIRAVQRAIQRYGILARPELVGIADEVLTAIQGFLDTGHHLRAVNRARTQDELLAALHDIRNSCRRMPAVKPIKWELVAAIAAD